MLSGLNRERNLSSTSKRHTWCFDKTTNGAKAATQMTVSTCWHLKHLNVDPSGTVSSLMANNYTLIPNGKSFSVFPVDRQISGSDNISEFIVCMYVGVLGYMCTGRFRIKWLSKYRIYVLIFRYVLNQKYCFSATID